MPSVPILATLELGMRGKQREARRLRPKISHRPCGRSLDWSLCQETRARRAADTPFAELLGIGIGAAISERTRVRVYGLYSQRQRRP